MNVIELKNSQNSLNKIESFIEGICDDLNIGDTFLGNMLIAITELVNIIENQNSDITISFSTEPKKFLFKFSILSDKFNFDTLKEGEKIEVAKGADLDDSLFMINALCDDLVIESEKNLVTLVFINPGINDEISNHRKKYLSNFLNQRIKV